MRANPSTRARQVSYIRLRKLFDLLEPFITYHPYRAYPHNYISVEHIPNYKGWKDWVKKYTPPDKRGGTGEPAKRRRQKKSDRQSTIR